MNNMIILFVYFPVAESSWVSAILGARCRLLSYHVMLIIISVDMIFGVIIIIFIFSTGFVVAVCGQSMISSGNAMASPRYRIKASTIDELNISAPVRGNPVPHICRSVYLSQLVDGRAKLMHVVVVMMHSSFSIGSNLVIHEVSANFTVDGISADQSSSQYFVSTSSLDPSSWDPRGQLNLFPSLGMLSTVNAQRAGNVYYLAMYKKVGGADSAECILRECADCAGAAGFVLR